MIELQGSQLGWNIVLSLDPLGKDRDYLEPMLSSSEYQDIDTSGVFCVACIYVKGRLQPSERTQGDCMMLIDDAMCFSSLL